MPEIVALCQVTEAGPLLQCEWVGQKTVQTLVRGFPSVRPAARLGVLLTVLLCLGTVSFAPNVGVAEPRGASAEPRVPDPLTAPPHAADLADLRLPRVRARAAMVYNPRTHEVLWERNGYRPRPIASITKVMTVLLFLEQEPDLSRDVVVSRRDVRRASTTYLRRGERILLRELVHLALVGSDNAAARVLARVSPWGTRGFVQQMNRRAAELGLTGTTFADPSGLNKDNVSTPYDVSRLITHASEHPRMSEIMQKRTHRLHTSRQTRNVRNTNRLLLGKLEVLAGKTGYIDAAGYCLATFVKIPGVPEGEPLAVVVLGVGSSSGRFRDVTRLVDWVSDEGRSLLPSHSAN